MISMRLKVLTGIVAITAVTTTAVIPVSSAGAQGAPAIKSAQELAMLHETKKVFATPGGRRSKIRTVAAVRPITGGGTVLPVSRHVTKKKVKWLRVLLPGRPNGTKGWITQSGTVRAITNWQVVVRTSSRQVRAYHKGKLARSFNAIVGQPSTPTPSGKFFVEENIRMNSRSPGAPFALALSARSNVLQEFEGGPGQIGIHGVANLGGTLGTASSHGCVRLANLSIRWLAARIAPGAPVTIAS